MVKNKNFLNNETINSCPSFYDFVKTGKSNVIFDKFLVFVDDNGYCYFYDNGIVHFTRHQLSYSNWDVFKAKDIKNKYKNAAVLIPYKNKKQSVLPILNGDIGAYSNVGLDLFDYDFEFITTSFDCLSRFYNCDVQKIAEMILNGTIIPVDWTKDEIISLTSKEKRLSKINLKPPQSGFSLIGSVWHRSATVLFYDTEKKFSMLLGQDEGTYFGCELEDNPKTIKAAFRSLMPSVVKNFKQLSVKDTRFIKRQGEWFAVPVKEPPKEYAFCCKDCRFYETAWLSVENKESAKHYLQSEHVIVGVDGIVYAFDSTLVHSNGDHYMLFTDKWVAYYRNTAVRSFSVKGVD